MWKMETGEMLEDVLLEFAGYTLTSKAPRTPSFQLAGFLLQSACLLYLRTLNPQPIHRLTTPRPPRLRTWV